MKRKNWIYAIIAIIVTTIYLSYNITLGYDSSHYVWLSTMFTKQLSFSNWDVVRSFVFPFIIFVFNFIFGKSRWALLILTFIFYISMLVICIQIYKYTIKENEKNKWVKFLLIMLFWLEIAFNPIIFGFYHVILTEFMAMTLIVLMCYLVWKWIEVDFFENKKKYILYTIIFCVLVCFSWHLKQPYILASLIPLITATIMAIVKKREKRNIIQRLTTIGVCIVTLIISIISWNLILKLGNVKQVKDRTTSGLVDNIIINGLSMYQRDKNPKLKTVEGIREDENLVQEDKEKMIQIIEGKNEEYKNYIIFDYKPYNEIIEPSTILYLKEEAVSTNESLSFYFKILKEHPKRILESYVINYLTLNDIYKLRVDSTYGMKYYTERIFHWTQDTEINFLGYSMYRDSRNDLDLPECYASYSKEYCSINSYIPIVNKIMVKRMAPSIVIFKIIMVFLPIYWILSIVMITRKKEKYKKSYERIQQLITILYTYSVVQIVLYVFAGSNVDRYAVPPYLATLLALGLQAFIIIRRKKFINDKENENDKTENKTDSRK